MTRYNIGVVSGIATPVMPSAASSPPPGGGGHIEPHLTATGLCQCPCGQCTTRLAKLCICAVCHCETPADHEP